MRPVFCPSCGVRMVLKLDGEDRWFYGCPNYPACQNTHGAHQESGEPMGIPADAETRQWRIRAHKAFDMLWKSGEMSRSAAYRLLQRIMDLPEDEAHIGRFDRDQCQELIDKIQERKS